MGKQKKCVIYIKKVALVLLAFMLFAGLTPGISTQAAEDVNLRTVRVGFFSADGYHMMDKDGTMSGYGFDFLQMMLRYNNWKYEYVGYDKNCGDMLDMLDKGEIDMVTLANKTPERLEKYGFSEKSLGSSSTIMTIGAKNTDIVPGEYATYDKAVVGLV
ncbi:MAG: transporter substrate-binding domain-containing protein [Lachnospiraceae bacterium]|nr:transporter substrate-binding domain-containing protein [Lachnospiraceae bacterium]